MIWRWTFQDLHNIFNTLQGSFSIYWAAVAQNLKLQQLMFLTIREQKTFKQTET